jgi:hypothetical protein
MTEREAESRFTEADFRAALELFGSSSDAAKRAREISAAVAAAESARIEYQADPRRYLERRPAAEGEASFPTATISPDLLMMLSVVSPDLEAKVRSYMNAGRLITGSMAEGWETQRSKPKGNFGKEQTSTGLVISALFPLTTNKKPCTT